MHQQISHQERNRQRAAVVPPVLEEWDPAAKAAMQARVLRVEVLDLEAARAAVRAAVGEMRE